MNKNITLGILTMKDPPSLFRFLFFICLFMLLRRHVTDKPFDWDSVKKNVIWELWKER